MKQFLAFLLFLSFGLSQSVVIIQDSEIEINENEAVVEVLGNGLFNVRLWNWRGFFKNRLRR